MHIEDSETTTNVGFIEHYLAVKASGTQERGVEYVWAVGGSDDDDVGIFVEAIHFDEQLVEGLLAFVVTASAGAIALATNGVDFVDEHDARCVCFCFFEEITHTSCTNPDEHFDEFGAANAIERYIGFACYCAGDECLACAWCAD